VGVGDEIVGRPVNAVLAPPQAERFAAVADVDPNRLVLNVTGCNKLVLLDSDRVFLFPRSATGVEWFERELADRPSRLSPRNVRGGSYRPDLG
jgi:hypothetical protein